MIDKGDHRPGQTDDAIRREHFIAKLEFDAMRPVTDGWGREIWRPSELPERKDLEAIADLRRGAAPPRAPVGGRFQWPRPSRP